MDSLLADKIQFLHGLLKLSILPPGVINNNLQLYLPVEQVSFARGKLDHWNIRYETIVEGELLINLSSIHVNTVVFLGELNFRQGVEATFDKNGAIVKNIALVDYKNAFLIYDCHTAKTYSGSAMEAPDFLVENAVDYYQVLAALKGKRFADYVNPLDKEIVLYSGTKGIKRIRVPDYLPALDPSKPIRHDCHSLLSKLQSPDFSIYFKNQLFEFRNSETATGLQDIIISLETITREADNNLQLYLKNFSFENLKSSLQKEKEKYFSSLRDILGKNLSQIVAIPVSFAASVFATYKVNDVFILLIILVAFILYSIFTRYLQSLYLKDVKEIEDSFNRDFTIIAERSGLMTIDIDIERTKIVRRISDIKNVIRRFRYLLVGLTIIFTIFIGYQLVKLV